MFNNSNRTQEKYPYNSYRPSRGSRSQRQEPSRRIFNYHNQNDLSTSEYSANYDGNISAHHPGSNELNDSVNIDVICSQNYKSSEGENWTCEYEEEKAGNFSNNTKFRSYRYKKREVCRNSNINSRNNYLYDSYYKKPYRKYEENKQTFDFQKYPFHSQASYSDGQRVYSARDSSSNFGSESFSYENYRLQNWKDDYETVDMDISDSENNYSRTQKRKSDRYDNIPYKKGCYQHNQTLSLKHSDSSDITDDDYIGLKGKDIGRNFTSSNNKEHPYKRSSVLEKSSLESSSKKWIDSEMKRNSIIAETERGLIGDGSNKKQKNSYENLSKPVTDSATIKTSAINNNFKNSNLKYVEIQQEVSTAKEIEPKQRSAEDLSNMGNKSGTSTNCPKQRKTGNANSFPSSGKSISNKTKKECSFDSDKERIECSQTPLKKGGQSPGSEKPDVRKSQENLKQLEDVTKSSSDNPQKQPKNVIEVFSESKKTPSGSSGDTQKQHKIVIEVSSGTKKLEKLLPPDNTQKQHKNIIEVSSVPKKLLPSDSSPDNTQKQHNNIVEVSPESRKTEKLLPAKTFQSSSIKSQSKDKKFNCDDPKKKTNLVKKERALSLHGQSSQVSSGNKEEETTSKNKKLKVSHRKSIDSKFIKENVAETKSNNLDHDISDSVIDDILADLDKQIYVVADSKAIKDKDNNKLPSSVNKQKTVVVEAGTAAKNKDCSKSSSTSTKKTSSVASKCSKENDKVDKKKENEVKNKDPHHNKLVKSKEDISSKQITSKCIKKSASESRTPIDSGKAKHDIEKIKKRKIESENTKLSTPIKSNANASKSTSKNQKLVNDESSKVCEKNSLTKFTKETTAPLKGIITNSSELVPKLPKNADVVQTGVPTTNNEEEFQMKTKSVSDGIKPAKRITQRRGKSCDARSFTQADYLETLNLKPITRSKSVEPHEFTSFRITRSKSPFYGLYTGLPPATRLRSRSRSRSSSVPKQSEEDKQESNKYNTDRILKASDEVKVYKPLLIDMDNRKSVGGYSPRDDDDEVAMHMVNQASRSSMIQHRAIDPRDPRKNQFAKQNPVKNGKELIKLKDFVRERFEEESKKGTTSYENEQTKKIQNILRDVNPVEQSFVNRKDNKSKSPKDKFLKQRKASNINAVPSKSENKKCTSSNVSQIKKQPVGHDTPKLNDVGKKPVAKVNVRLEVIEGYFPREETNENCIRLNVSNGTEERTVTIQKPDVLQVDFNIEDGETNTLITDSLIRERAQVSNVPNRLHKATTTVITIQEANQSEEVVDLTLDDSCEEQSDLTSINDINRLTEQLLEMYGDEMKLSVVKPESLSSPNSLLNILESPTQRRGTQTTSEIEEAPENNNNTAPYTITIKPLVPVQSNEEAPSITIEIPDFPIAESTRINSLNTSDMVVTTNCVISELSEPSNRISTNSETSQTVAAQNNLVLHNQDNAKKTNPNETRQNSSQSSVQCLVPDTANLSTIMSETASKQMNVSVPSSSDAVAAPNRNASEPPKAGTLSSNESNQGYRPSMTSNTSMVLGILSSQLVKQRRLSNKTVPPQNQTSSTSLSTTPTNSFGDQQSVNQNLPVLQLQHLVEKHSQRPSHENLLQKLTEVPPNRIAPCNHHGHPQTNAKAYRDFLSNNVHYILKYQCVMDMFHHSFPTYAKSLSEASSKKYAIPVVQNFFEQVLSNIERDMRQYYNAVNLDVEFKKFLVDLDVELARSGQKLFWKWNLEFLCRLLCRNTSCGLSLNSCYQKFISDLKKYYDTYVSRCRNAQRILQNAQNNSAEKTALRPSNISVVPLATLQDPNLSTSNSHVQRSSSDQHLTQSIQTSINNTLIFPIPPTSIQTSSSKTQRSSSDLQQHIQSIQSSNSTVIFPVPSTPIQTNSSKTRRLSSDQQQHIQSIQRSSNAGILPVSSTSIQTGSSKTQRPSSDQHQPIQLVQRSNNLSPSTSSNHVTPNQAYGMTPQQCQLFLQQVEKYKELDLLLTQQNASSLSKHYVGGNFSGRTGRCGPSQESTNRRATNLERLLEQSCNQLKHIRHQGLRAGQKSQNDYSQNLLNIINARTSSTMNGASVHQRNPPPYPVNSTLQFQQNKVAPLRPEINEQRPLIGLNLPQQQQSCINLPPQNNVTEMPSIERIFSRIMMDMAKNNSLINVAVPHPQSQVNTPRREADQNRASQVSTEVQNLNAPDLNVTLGLNTINSQNQQLTTTQNTSAVTSTQNSCTISTRQPLSSNSQNRRVSVQERMASCTTDNHSVITTRNEHVSTENDQTSDCNRNLPSVFIPKEEVSTEVELTVNGPQNQVNDEFIDFENYLTNTHGENWDDDIEVFWPENYVVLPLAEEVKNEDDVQAIVEDDPIPRSESNDSGIESPIDIVLPSQFYV